jgi:hypothetical protein
MITLKRTSKKPSVIIHNSSFIIHFFTLSAGFDSDMQPSRAAMWYPACRNTLSAGFDSDGSLISGSLSYQVAIPSQRVSIPTAGQIGLVVMRVFKADLPQVPIFTSKGVSPK